MKLIPLETPEDVGQWTAKYIVEKINIFQPSEDRPFVLGLPTGGTPLTTYKSLIKYYENGDVSFKHVVTFNMDEYVGIPRDAKESYRTFMFANLFNHIDIPQENVHILDGTAADTVKECGQYEEKIRRYGKIHLFLGGVGNDGHVAFNEPASSLSSRTRMITLTEETRRANARFFDGDMTRVPKQALTIGVGTLLDAEEVLILALGINKAKALYHAVEGAINHLWTISALQWHPCATFVCDEEATSELKVKTLKYFRSLANEE